PSVGVSERAIVLGEAFQRLPGQVETIVAGVAALELGDDAEALGVVVEAAVDRHGLVEGALAGVSERRMAEVMGKRQGLGKVLVELQGPRQSPRDLRHFKGMGEPRAVVVALVVEEDLRLFLEAAESGR